jgi:hypothetical protein
MKRLAFRLSAELGVIVLGVWIALWAEGRAAERGDRSTEDARLEALVDNVGQVRAVIASEADDAERASQALRALVVSTEMDSEAIRERLLEGLFYAPTASVKSSVYDDLKNSGELALLTDGELRRALSDMEASFDALSEAQRDMVTVQQLNIDPYLISHLDLGPILGDSLELPGGSGDFDAAVLRSPEFRNLSLFKLDLVVMFGQVLEDADERLERVVALVDR